MKQQNPTKYELKAVKHIHLCVESSVTWALVMLIPLACSEKSLLCQYQESYYKAVAFITALLHVTRDVLDNRLKLELLGSETWPGFCGVLCNEDISSALVNLSLHVPRRSLILTPTQCWNLCQRSHYRLIFHQAIQTPDRHGHG